MLPPEIRCVVGIDVAKQAHVVCALEAPSGGIRHKPSRIEATAEGHALLCSWLETWGNPEQTVIGLEATGPLWEPLYDAPDAGGLPRTGAQSTPDRVVGLQPGAASQARWDRCADPGPWPVGGIGPRQHLALRGGAGLADPDPCAA